jgi:hypothetical protein
MNNVNLNNSFIPCADGPSQPLMDYSIRISQPRFDSIEVVLKNLERRLVKIIGEFQNDAIFGCVAWLTSKPILDALAKCKNVQIIVQKEDFLRPDISTRGNWKGELRRQYSAIKCSMERHQFRHPMGDLSVCCDPTVDGVRCVGNHNSQKQAAFPRAHHKFLVFCRTNCRQEPDFFRYEYHPVKVWTGSFNMTKNATQSFENAIVLEDNSGRNPAIDSFLSEHHQVFGISESLNWQSIWSEPEFRIGT